MYFAMTEKSSKAFNISFGNLELFPTIIWMKVQWDQITTIQLTNEICSHFFHQKGTESTIILRHFCDRTYKEHYDRGYGKVKRGLHHYKSVRHTCQTIEGTVLQYIKLNKWMWAGLKVAIFTNMNLNKYTIVYPTYHSVGLKLMNFESFKSGTCKVLAWIYFGI